jgi:hypothetical protein
MRRERLLHVGLAAVLVSGTAWADVPGKGLTVGPGEHGSRRALVIGNQAYSRSALLNPRHDAESMAAKLGSLGFDVKIAEDLSLRSMDRAVDDYLNTLRRGDISFVYYSGHGVQVDGANFLVPIDFAGQDEKDVRYDAYPLDKLMDKLEDRGLALSVVVLDACRDNPFRSTRGGSRGLAGVNAASGTLIAFATSPGKAAADGAPGENGVFTASLLSALDKEGVDVDELFKVVREDVAAKTGSEQVPWSSSSVIGKFCLKGTCFPTLGTLQIMSVPSGAAAAVDGSAVGVTPFDRELAAGEHTVSLSLTDYAPVTLHETVEPGKTRSRAVALTPTIGALRVETTPVGARVFIDGTERGITPYAGRVSPTQHVVALLLDGYETITETVTAKAGLTSVVAKALAPLPSPKQEVAGAPQSLENVARPATALSAQDSPHPLPAGVMAPGPARAENQRTMTAGRGWGVAALVVGAVALAAGTGLAVAAGAQTSAGKSSPQGSSVQASINNVNAMETGALIGWVGGGVLASTGTALVVAFP